MFEKFFKEMIAKPLSASRARALQAQELDQMVQDDLSGMKKGLEHLYENRGTMSRAQLVQLYMEIFSFIASNSTRSTYAKSKWARKTFGKGNDSQNKRRTYNKQGPSNGEIIYLEAKKFLNNYLDKKIAMGKNLHGIELLEFYTKLWHDFRSTSMILDSACSYMNKNWVQWLIQKEKRKDIVPVYWLTILVWKESVFDKLHKKVTGAVLDLIDQERKGGATVDTKLVRGVIDSYIELGYVEDDDGQEPLANTISERLAGKVSHLGIYEAYFEMEFLVTTRNYYLKEALALYEVNTNNHECNEQMDQQLQKEQRRVDACLDQTTRPKLRKHFATFRKTNPESCMAEMRIFLDLSKTIF